MPGRASRQRRFGESSDASHRIIEGESRVKNIWAQSLLIPVCVAIVVAIGIVGIGETYLALGDGAIFLALPLMFIIMIVAALLTKRTETDGEA